MRLWNEDGRTEFVVAPHHPDRLRRPLPTLVAPGIDAFRHALTWNVFRTLELISPPFWLRRFHLRLASDASLLAAHVIKVQLWPALQLPPVRRIDGNRSDVVVDVVIETEHDVWTLLVPAEGAVSDLSERAADVLDVGGWLAGRRAHHCGVVECPRTGASLARILKTRYGRSRDSALLRSTTRGIAAPISGTWGGLSWSGLAAVLQDCADASSLSSIERALARNALDWLQSVDIQPG